MKKALMGSFVLLTAAWMLQSCESTPEAINLDAHDITVVGANDNQLKVVPEIYQLTQRETSKGSGMWLLNMRIKLNTGNQALIVTDAPAIELLDEMGEPIDDCVLKIGDNAMDTKSKNDFAEFAKLTDSTEQTFGFFLNLTNLDKVALIMKQAKGFRLIVGGETSDSMVESSYTIDETEEAEETPSGGIEAILPSSLQGKVEVVSVDGVDVDDNAYPEISVTFKLLQTVNTASLVSEYGQLWIVGVAQDASGSDVKELLPNYKQWRSGDSDGEEFKQFLEDTPGNTITMHFTGDNGLDVFESDATKIEAARERVNDAANRVKKFKLKLVND
ncbi:MAG: hypothetical protein IJT97_04555 [Bacteroidaceae bacterium]|nr:hypothetical protein [Bacteroidaceae bacterium]